MLVNCPKCGFSQPQDQYCANCGVNMQQFKPKEPSLLFRLISSPFSFLIVASLVAVGSWYFIQQKQLLLQKITNSPDLRSTSNDRHISNAIGDNSTTVSANQALDSNNTNSNSLNPGSSNLPATNPSIPNPAVNPTSHSQGSTTEGSATSPPTNTLGNSSESENHKGILVKVYYAEVDHKTLASFIDESQNIGQFLSLAEMKAGVMQQLKQKLQSSGIRILHKIDRKFDAQQLGHHWFFGKKSQDTDLDQGFATLLSLSDVEMYPLRAELEIGRALRESEGTVLPVRRSFPLSFELQKGQGLFVSGLLPHRDLMELNEELSSIQVFRLFKSPNFLKGDSELTIFFEFEKNSP